MWTTVRVWEQVTATIMTDDTVSPHTLLWGNLKLLNLRSIPDASIWAGYGIVKIQAILPAETLLPFPMLQETFQLSPWMLFHYVQLKHAAQAQFPRLIIIIPHVVQRFLTSRNADRILSSIYLRITCRDSDRDPLLFRSWKENIPTLSEEEWDQGIQQYISAVISSRDRFILARIYPMLSEMCPKC